MKTTTAVQANLPETEEASLSIALKKTNNVVEGGNNAATPKSRASKKKTKTVYTQLVSLGWRESSQR